VQIIGNAEEQERRKADSVVALVLETGLEDNKVYRVPTISGAFTVFKVLDMSKI
jgi:hypothetical protein